RVFPSIKMCFPELPRQTRPTVARAWPLATSKRYGIARSPGELTQTLRQVFSHTGIRGQFHGPAIGLSSLRAAPRLGQQMRPRRPRRLKSLDGRVIDRVQRAKPHVGAVDLAVDGRGRDG